jgi:hypothetical protein
MIRTFLTLTTALLLAWPSMGAAPKPYVTSVMVNTNGAIVGPTNFWTGLTNDPNFRSVMSGMVIPGEATNIVWSAPGANATASTNGLVVTLNPKVGHAELLGVTNFVGSTSNSLRSFVTATFLGGATSFNTRTGPITLLQADVVSALGFSPTNSGITNGFATTASLNSSVGTLVQRVTDATNNLNAAVDGRFLKLTGGTMSGAISNAVAYGPDGNLLGASSDAVTNNQALVRMGELNVTNSANVGNLTVQGSAQFDGEVNTSAYFNGSGSGLTGLNASALATGTVPPDRLTNIPPASISGIALVATSANAANIRTLYGFYSGSAYDAGLVRADSYWLKLADGNNKTNVSLVGSNSMWLGSVAAQQGFHGNISAATNSAGNTPVFQGGDTTNNIVSTHEFYSGVTNAASLATDATGKLIVGTGTSADAVTNNQVSVAFENLTVGGEDVATIPYVNTASNAIVAQMADLEISGVSDWTTFRFATTDASQNPHRTNILSADQSWQVETRIVAAGPTNYYAARLNHLYWGTNCVWTNVVMEHGTGDIKGWWLANAEGNAVFAFQGAANENVNVTVKYTGVTETNGLVNPPSITFHGVIETNQTDATFAWTTTPATTGVLDLGETTAFELYHFTNNVATTAHTNQATGLTAGATYHYQVRSAFSGMWVTNGGSFETAAAAPTYLVSEDCEGTGVPSGWANNGTPNWDFNNPALAGSQSLFLDAASKFPTKTFTATPDIWIYLQFQITNTTGWNRDIVVCGDSSSAELVKVRPTANREFNLIVGAASTLSAVNVWNEDTTYHAWLHYIKGTGSDAKAYLYWATNTAVRPSSPLLSKENGTPTADAATVWFRGMDGSASIIDTIRVDDVEIGSNPL